MSDQTKLVQKLWPGIGALLVLLLALLCYDYVSVHAGLAHWATFCGALVAILLGLAGVELTNARMWPKPVSKTVFTLIIFMAVATACWIMALTALLKGHQSMPLDYLPLLNPADITVLFAWLFTLFATSMATQSPPVAPVVRFVAAVAALLAALIAAYAIARRSTDLLAGNQYFVVAVGVVIAAVLMWLNSRCLFGRDRQNIPDSGSRDDGSNTEQAHEGEAS
ncbi:MAG: hypothetical protein HKM24_06500 [Gammaproteobacteria bacterium]|nr:hypothetical protein [Gammaproteobacteria bacterium]